MQAPRHRNIPTPHQGSARVGFFFFFLLSLFLKAATHLYPDPGARLHSRWNCWKEGGKKTLVQVIQKTSMHSFTNINRSFSLFTTLLPPPPLPPPPVKPPVESTLGHCGASCAVHGAERAERLIRLYFHGWT